jgi:hypothetical protein
MKKTIALIPLFLLVALFQFCSKKDSSTILSTELQPTLPSTTFNYLSNYPTHVQVALANSDNVPTDNPITNAGATLGRVLFYDKQLSKNNTVSCGSCHKQASAFDDTLVLSKGFEAGLTTRNSMSLLNIRFYKSGKMFCTHSCAAKYNNAHKTTGTRRSKIEIWIEAQLTSLYPTLDIRCNEKTAINSELEDFKLSSNRFVSYLLPIIIFTYLLPKSSNKNKLWEDNNIY